MDAAATVCAVSMTSTATIEPVPATRLPRRLLVSIAAGLMAIVLGAAAANVMGVMPLDSGPLGNLEPVEYGSAFGMATPPSQQALYTTYLLENAWPVAATIDAVRVLGSSQSAGIEVLGSRPYASATDETVLGVQADLPPSWASYRSVAGSWVEPLGDRQHAGTAILVRLDPVVGHDTIIRGLEVDYSIGPVHFRTTAQSAVAQSVLICAANPDDQQFRDLCQVPPT
jgi:hypothetical protein